MINERVFSFLALPFHEPLGSVAQGDFSWALWGGGVKEMPPVSHGCQSRGCWRNYGSRRSCRWKPRVHRYCLPRWFLSSSPHWLEPARSAEESSSRPCETGTVREEHGCASELHSFASGVTSALRRDVQFGQEGMEHLALAPSTSALVPALCSPLPVPACPVPLLPSPSSWRRNHSAAATGCCCHGVPLQMPAFLQAVIN